MPLTPAAPAAGQLLRPQVPVSRIRSVMPGRECSRGSAGVAHALHNFDDTRLSGSRGPFIMAQTPRVA